MMSEKLLKLIVAVVLACGAAAAIAHDISADNARYVQNLTGTAVGPFLYLGAKHMFTGYDHLLFILGVVFFLSKPRDIILYVTLFTIGHSATLLLGVLANWRVSGELVDAIIGLSVVYKAFENINGFKTLSIWQPDTRVAVFVFGLCHGLGLATKLQDYISSDNGLFVNLVSFNIGVEIGQLLALSAILLVLTVWRRQPGFANHTYSLNLLIMCAGFVLFGFHLTGYLLI